MQKSDKKQKNQKETKEKLLTNVYNRDTMYMTKLSHWLLDSPGEYAEVHGLGAALAIYAYEADIVALLISADDDYSLFPPNKTCMVNREVIGIVTKIDKSSPERAESWLKLSGCEKVFFVNSHSGEGVEELKAYLKKYKINKYQAIRRRKNGKRV